MQSYTSKSDSITLTSDIHILFNGNTSSNEVERILRENGITTIEQLLKLTTSDLLIVGISDLDAEALFIRARQLVFTANQIQAAFPDVWSWLKAHNLENFAPHFNNIEISMVPYIRRSDLTITLKIPIFESQNLNRLWEAITKLEFKLPPPVSYEDDSCELICTTTQSPITVDLNEANFIRMYETADNTESSIKVSFVGDTGAGKSLIISQLLSFDDRIRHARGPLVAVPGQLESTTGNVCVYSTSSNDGKHKFMLLDFEGAYGSLPRRLLSKLNILAGNVFLNSSSNNPIVNEMTKERHEVVKTIFPQIAYVISNIVVLIDKQPPHHTGYIEKLTKFAELSTKNSGTGEKPFLIIIQNFANPDNQKDGTASYTLRQSTSDFMQCLSQQKKTQELLQHYREICFIRLPSWTSERLLFDQQICLLQSQLVTYAEILKKESWFSKNFWNDQLWFTFVKQLCNEFKQPHKEVNVPKLIAAVVQPQLTPVLRIMNFWRLIWTPPVVGKEKNADEIKSNWMHCFRIAIERLADLMFDELRSPDMNHALVKNTLITAVEEFVREIWQYFPCLHRIRDEYVCGIAKSLHMTGHYGQRSGEHEGMEPPPNTLNLVIQRIRDLKDIDPTSRAKRSLDLTSKGLQRLSSDERHNLKSKWIPFCMLCLKNFTQDRSVISMKCSHVLCDTCARLAKDLPCPIHNTLFSYFDYKRRMPSRAFPRVLSLDGGGIRGIIQIRILEQIEKMTGYKIHQLFDIVVGSGIGGLIALLVALKRDPVSNYTDLFLEYPQRIFKGDVFVKLGFWSKYKYKTKFIQAIAEELFGDITMSNSCGPEQIQVAVTAYRKGAIKWGPVFFTNYVHGAGLEETKDFSGRRLIHNCRVSETAAVTSSTPPFFRPQYVGDDEYVDGSFVANNPSMYALKEVVFLWKRPADCLVSIGTGFCDKTPPKVGDTKLNWAKHTVELVKETLEVHEKTTNTCNKHCIFYARHNPDLDVTFRTDAVTTNELQKLSDETLQYLIKSSEAIKNTCQRLIAALVYIDEIVEEKKHANNESAIKITLHSRQLPFRVSPLLGGPSWQISCLNLKGDFTAKIDYNANGTENPIAIVRLDHVKPEHLVGIDLVVGDKNHQICGGGCIALSPPYTSTGRLQNNTNSTTVQTASTITKLASFTMTQIK